MDAGPYSPSFHHENIIPRHSIALELSRVKIPLARETKLHDNDVVTTCTVQFHQNTPLMNFWLKEAWSLHFSKVRNYLKSSK